MLTADVLLDSNTTDEQQQFAAARQTIIKTIKRIYKLNRSYSPKWRNNMLKHYESELINLIMRQADIETLPSAIKQDLLQLMLPKYYKPVTKFI